MRDATDELLDDEAADEDADIAEGVVDAIDIDAAVEAAALAAVAAADVESLLELGPRESVCSVGNLAHCGPCWCGDLPVVYVAEAGKVDGVWVPWDTAMIKAGHYSPRPALDEAAAA
jgi:hypothetical protein